jgi:hypothetical protein
MVNASSGPRARGSNPNYRCDRHWQLRCGFLGDPEVEYRLVPRASVSTKLWVEPESRSTRRTVSLMLTRSCTVRLDHGWIPVSA